MSDIGSEIKKALAEEFPRLVPEIEEASTPRILRIDPADVAYIRGMSNTSSSCAALLYAPFSGAIRGPCVLTVLWI